MKDMLSQAMSHGRMTITTAVLLAAAGLLAWVTMPRQEDPNMPDYWGNVITVFPGADAETVERLILEPLEEHLAEVEDIGVLTAQALNERVMIDIELDFAAADIQQAWDDVQEALDEAQKEFPEGALSPQLDYKLNRQESIVLAVRGHADPLKLEDAAQLLKDNLLGLREVIEVRLIGEPGEQITIELDDAQARRLGVDTAMIAQALKARNQNIPGGTIKLIGRSVNLKPNSDFQSLQEIRETPVVLPSGNAIPLSQIANIRFGPREPASGIMRYNGERAVGLGVVPRENVHLLQFGETVKAQVEALKPQLAPLTVDTLIYQPARVNERLSGLGRSLMMGIGIVAAILLVFMGMRLGLIVASVLPLVAFASLALFAWSGGKLHQMSISALVIALGMLVDNAIVMAENVQWRIDRGTPRLRAATEAIRELSIPLASATGTTLAAFIPMLMAEGVTADFTRDLPIVIMLSLVVSYVFAVFITPKLASLFLKQRKNAVEEDLGTPLANIALKRPWLVLVMALILVAGSIYAAKNVGQQFFPSSDRNQLVVELKLPEGSHLDSTSEAASKLERMLLARDDVRDVASYIGRSAPHFYYNLSQIPWMPHFSQIVVTTESWDHVERLAQELRRYAAANLPEYQVIPRKLEQGPPVDHPVEVRLFGEDLAQLQVAADQVLAQLRDIEGTIDTLHDLSLGAPGLDFQVNDAAAARQNLSRAHVAETLYGRTRGLSVGQYRAGDDPVPVLLRSAEGESLSSDQLATLDVAAPGSQAVPLAQVADIQVNWRPAAIRHRDRSRVVTVSANLEEGVPFSTVMAKLEPIMAAMELPPGVRYQFGGLGEGSQEANGAMAGALPFGMLLLFGILLLEFNSFRRVGIVLVTVPLAATGVIPGLLISGESFGFMSMLGVISLIGIVVNNAIVLLDVIETQRSEGASIREAVHTGILRRTRPILLTTTTTVTGLLPLAFSGSNLWPPMAWAIISGLIASTMLTLLVVPSLYLVLFREVQGTPAKGKALATALLVAITCLPAISQEPKTITLEQAMDFAINRNAAVAVRKTAEAADARANAFAKENWRPSFSMSGTYTYTDDLAEIQTPVGEFQLGERNSAVVRSQLLQPIYRRAEHYGLKAMRQSASAQHQSSQRTIAELKAAAADAFFAINRIDAQLSANETFIESLEGRLEEMKAMEEAGRVLRSDVLKIQLQRDDARHESNVLNAQRQVALYRLARASGTNQPFEPAPHEPFLLVEESLPESLAVASEQRPDLRALNTQIDAADLQMKSIRAERLPRLEAFVNHSYADGDAFQDGSYLEGGLQFSWRPFAGGSRKPRIVAAKYEHDALLAQLEEQRQEILLEVRQAHANLETAHGALTVAHSGVALAEETLRVERARFEAGRITTNDLLAAEASLRQQQTRKAIAEIDARQALIQLKLATASL